MSCLGLELRRREPAMRRRRPKKLLTKLTDNFRVTGLSTTWSPRLYHRDVNLLYLMKCSTIWLHDLLKLYIKGW